MVFAIGRWSQFEEPESLARPVMGIGAGITRPVWSLVLVHHVPVVVPVGGQLVNVLLQVSAAATCGHAIREEKPEHQS